MSNEKPEDAAILRVISDSVTDHLAWNVNAYGKAWTGEGEDTDFLVAGTLKALREAGYGVVRDEQ